MRGNRYERKRGIKKKQEARRKVHEKKNEESRKKERKKEMRGVDGKRDKLHNKIDDIKKRTGKK